LTKVDEDIVQVAVACALRVLLRGCCHAWLLKHIRHDGLQFICMLACKRTRKQVWQRAAKLRLTWIVVEIVFAVAFGIACGELPFMFHADSMQILLI
jgi:hypothetical protein